VEQFLNGLLLQERGFLIERLDQENGLPTTYRLTGPVTARGGVHVTLPFARADRPGLLNSDLLTVLIDRLTHEAQGASADLLAGVLANLRTARGVLQERESHERSAQPA
jgi:hypothetical protein